MNTEIVSKLTSYVDDVILPYLEVPGNEELYPEKLLSDLADMGLFGVTVPKDFGGMGLPPTISLEINEELARGWQSLIALVGTHFGLCSYFTTCGTDSQKATWLPKLASGDLRGAHAYHERSRPHLDQIRTHIARTTSGDLQITGHKDWVTNAAQASRLMVVCRHPDQEGLAAAWIDPQSPGVTIGPDLPRTGLKGVPLNSVTLEAVAVDETDVVGGLDNDISAFMHSRGAGADVGFAARSLGAARAIAEEVHAAYKEDPNLIDSRRFVNAQRLVDLDMNVFTIRAVVEAAIARAKDERAAEVASFAKVTASGVLQEIVQIAMAVVGGASYASVNQRLHRACRDAMSLTLVDTTNGTLLGAVADSRS